MGGILGGKSKGTGPTIANNLQLQSSVYGNAIAIVYGTTRVSPNLIWYGSFVATPISQGSKGGKGSIVGGGGKAGNGQYNYQVAVAMALCEGPIQNVRNVYIDKTVTTLPAVNLSLFTGTYPQAPWGFLQGQQVVTTETHTIPASGPYTVTVALATTFMSDAGVNSGTPPITYTFTGGYDQPQVTQEFSLNPNGPTVVWLFYIGDAGKVVTITYSGSTDGTTSFNATIPANGLLSSSVSTNQTINPFTVVQPALVYTSVSGAPATKQYNVSQGVYTFNSAQAGDSVSINYYTFEAVDQALGYNGIAYVASSAYQLGSSAALPNHNFEVQGVYSNSVSQEVLGEQDIIPSAAYVQQVTNLSLNAGEIVVEYYASFIADGGVTDSEGNAYTAVIANPGFYQYTVSNGTYNFSPSNYGGGVNITYTANAGPDADPSLIVADYLTNGHYGAAFPSQYLGSLTTYQAYCIANGLLISVAITQQVPASQTLQDIATATNSAWVWSNGLLNLIPYGDQTVTQFGYTYTAPSAPVTSLDDDSYMRLKTPIGVSSATMNDNPVIMTRKRPADQINSIKLQCLDRQNNYNVATIEAKDQALIETFKLRQSAATNTQLFCNIGSARQSAQLQLQRQYIMNIYSFQLPQEYIFLDPMDIVEITDATMGLTNQWVRILEIQENDDGSLSMQAEEYLQGTGAAALYNFQKGLGYQVNYNIDPGNVNTPIIFEPTDALAGELAVWMAVSGMNTSIWGGCSVYISTDGNSFTYAGQIKGAAKQGVLLSPLASVTPAATGQTIDQTNTLAVNVSESNSQLLSGSQSDATNLNTLCYVDGEYIAYETSTLVASGEYDLTFLVRGAYDTTISAHAAGSLFARLNSGIFEFPYAAPLIGTTIQIKFLSFNIWGGGEQQLSEVNTYTYNVVGTAYTSALPNVAGFATALTSYSAGTTQLIWQPVSDFRQIDYEVRQGTTWSAGNFLYRTPLTQGPISGDGTYWIAAHFTVPNGGLDIYSETPVSLTITGSQITQNVIATYDQASTGWTGTFVNTAHTSLGLQLGSAGNILTNPSILTTVDYLYYGGVAASGTYTIPSAQIVNIGRVAPCQVIMKLGQETGYSLNAVNILALTDYLNATNILGIDLGNNTAAYAQINLSQDGSTYAGWQNWIPGTYSAKAYNARVVLETDDPTVLAVLTDFTFTVDVPTLDQTGTNVSIAAGGTAITFPNTFNGGPGAANTPNLQVTILNGSAGDNALVTLKTTSGFTLQIMNGGSGVARTCDYIAQGF